MHEFPPAAVHVRRHLTERELGSIAVALEMLAGAGPGIDEESARAACGYFDGLLSDDELRALGRELSIARKVKVCRSKQRAA